MSLVRLLLLGFWLLVQTANAWANLDQPNKVLRAYGPGGPYRALRSCAELYREQHGVEVQIIRALPHHLAERLPADGDLYYGGAEYMLEEFDARHPGIIDVASAARLHPRRIGILVRKGNPHGIENLDDLRREGIEVLDVKLEKMRHFHLDPGGDLGNIRRLEYTGLQGKNAWLTVPELDAWITYRSWHVELEEHSDFIEIPGERGLRYIPMALTHRTAHPQEAKKFIRFLQSDEARRIFEEHGWN